MKYTAKELTSRSVARLRQAGARLDRRTRRTLVPIIIIVTCAAPIWSAAVKFRSGGSMRPDSLRVPILVYHSIAPSHPGQSTNQRLLDVDTATFRRQMTYLATNKFNVIPLGSLVDAIQGHGNIPARSVVITFDDGWLSQYNHALPVLQEMHFTATFFVISQQIGKGSMYMDLDEVKAVQRAGMTIASHSRTHPDLTKLSDEQLRDEVQGSRVDLEKMLGVAPDLFAYPYGAWNKRVAAAAEEAGYRGARSLPGGSWNDVTDQYALHSILATDDMNSFYREVGLPIIALAPSSGRLAFAGQH